MKTRLFYSLLLITLFQFTISAQDKKSSDQKSDDNIYMTWNKTTPESEMNDDIKALKEHGVTISYSDVKRNSKGEITAIKVDFTDKNGSKGSLSLDNQKPINTIRFYKQNDEVGFGEPTNSNFMNGNLAYGFNPNDMMKGFQFNGNEDGLPGQQYHFEFPNGNSFGQSNSKVIIKKDGKKPLVIQDGNIVEGGDDYTKEELEEIKKNNKVESFSSTDIPNLDGYGFDNMQDQMKKMQEQIDQMMSKQSFGKSGQPSKEKSDLDQTREEMLKAKEEMEQAKKEMENARKELQNAKSSLKTQKT